MKMTQINLFNMAPAADFSQQVAQHNNLIFAPFALSSYESKIFISMLERIDRKVPGETFPEWRIPIGEVISYTGGGAYEELKKARHSLVGYVVDIAPVDPEAKRKKSMPRTIVRKCDHEEGKGFIICQFHEDMRDYLVKLIGNFTRADLAVLKRFKDEKSVRFYWMLKSRFYNGIASTAISLNECRQCLLPQGSTAYAYPNDFRKHILEKIIQKELSSTDCAFDIGKPLKNGKQTTGWTFILKQGSVTILGQAPLRLSEQMLSLLESCNMDGKGIAKINEMLGKTIGGIEITEAFIAYVVEQRRKEKQKKGNGVTSLAGYIVDTIREGWLSEWYINHLNGIPSGKPTQVYKQPVSGKRAASDGQSDKWITMNEAEAMYEKDKREGKTKYPIAGFIKALKTGRNIVVEGFSY